MSFASQVSTMEHWTNEFSPPHAAFILHMHVKLPLTEESWEHQPVTLYWKCQPTSTPAAANSHRMGSIRPLPFKYVSLGFPDMFLSSWFSERY